MREVHRGDQPEAETLMCAGKGMGGWVFREAPVTRADLDHRVALLKAEHKLAKTPTSSILEVGSPPEKEVPVYEDYMDRWPLPPRSVSS